MFWKKIKEKWQNENEEILARLGDFFWTTFAWCPILLIGLLFFVLGVTSEPTGTLMDMFIRMFLVIGKMFFAVYLGEVFQNLFFPFINFSVLRDVKNIDPKHFHIIYGRLILHGIMQFAVVNV